MTSEQRRQTAHSVLALRVDATFSPLQRCSSVTDHFGYAPSSRLGETKNRQQRGMARFFNSLLSEERSLVLTTFGLTDALKRTFNPRNEPSRSVSLFYVGKVGLIRPFLARVSIQYSLYSAVASGSGAPQHPRSPPELTDRNHHEKKSQVQIRHL